jgi:hypothetical protein
MPRKIEKKKKESGINKLFVNNNNWAVVNLLEVKTMIKKLIIN